jgi:anthranilate phosphoribosyltransferase
VYAERGESALVFHGDGGLDELSTTGPSTVWVACDGAVTVTSFDPAALGLPRASISDLRGGDPADNAAVVRTVLAGQAGPVRDIVLLNAAAAMTAARLGAAGESGASAESRVSCSDSDSLTKALGDGLARAAAAVDSGATAELLERWTQASHRLATPRPRA